MASPTIERLMPDDAARFRAIRLRALVDAPNAFGTTLEEDRARPLESWRHRLEDPAVRVFVARRSPAEGNVVGPADVGLVTAAPYRGLEDAAGLFGLWVDPEARAQGIGSALVDAVVGWARVTRYGRVVLDVADTNTAAIRLYERKGFEPTGGTGSLPPPRQHILETQLALAL